MKIQNKLKMKKKFFSLLIVLMAFLSVGSFTFANKTMAENGIVEQVSSALNSKSAVNNLAVYFDKTIEMTLLDKESNYSKSQAQAILSAFFQSHSITNFKLKHQGKSPDGSTFGIGTLTTSNGNFNVVFYAKQKGAQFLIQEIRFEKE
jgi:hypothetical protein